MSAWRNWKTHRGTPYMTLVAETGKSRAEGLGQWYVRNKAQGIAGSSPAALNFS